MNNKECVCCGVQWRDRTDTSYENLGSKSGSFVYTMRLILDKIGNHVELTFCNLHGNNLRPFIKYVNGILKIKNIHTNKWRKAKSIGIVV